MSKNLCPSLILPKRSLKYSGTWGVCTYEESGNVLWPVGGVNLQQEVLSPVFCSFSSHPYLSSEIKWALPYLTWCLWEADGWSESTSLFLFSLAPFCTRVCLPALPQWLEFRTTWIRILTPWCLSHLALESGMSLRSLVCKWKFYKDWKEWYLAEKSYTRNVSWPDFELFNTTDFYFFNDFPTLPILCMAWTQLDHIHILTPSSPTCVHSGTPFIPLRVSFLTCVQWLVI